MVNEPTIIEEGAKADANEKGRRVLGDRNKQAPDKLKKKEEEVQREVKRKRKR